MKYVRPGPWWYGLGRDLFLGAAVGASIGAVFHDLAYGTWVGAAIGFALHIYFKLRLR